VGRLPAARSLHAVWLEQFEKYQRAFRAWSDSPHLPDGRRRDPRPEPPEWRERNKEANDIRYRAWRAKHPPHTNGSGGTVINFNEEAARRAARDFEHKQQPAAPSPRVKIAATPYVWRDPASIPPRDFLYDDQIIRRYVSGVVSMGGVGKTSEVQVEIAAMITGRDLLGVKPKHPYRVWYINLEDPRDEIERRMAAIFKHYEIKPTDIDNHLFTDSGRDRNFIIEDRTRPTAMPRRAGPRWRPLPRVGGGSRREVEAKS
jgi:AAA domain-containing protein